MNNTYKLTCFEAIALLIVVMINKLILNLPYYVVELVGSGAIINIIYIGIIDFIIMYFIIKLFQKFDNSDIIDISESIGGKYLKIIISILSIIFLFLVSSVTLLNFCKVLKTIYFYDFTLNYILLFFIFGILIANLIGFKSICRICCLIAPVAIVSVIIAFGNTWTNLDIKSISPILGENYYQTFGIGITNCFALYIIVYLYFLKPLLKNNIKDFKKVSIISFCISFILLLLTTISMLTLFDFSSKDEPINSLFLLARQLEFGKFIQRVDALFIFLWILSILAYLSFIIFLINRIIKKLTNAADERMISYSTCSILFGITLIPFNISEYHFIENTIYKYSVIGYMFGICLIILIIGFFKKSLKGKS